MKNRSLIIIIFCIAYFLFSNGLNLGYAQSLTEEQSTQINKEFKGLWVATVLNLDYPSKATTDSEILKKEALKIIEDADAMGINAIVLQIRPTADAFYNSALFPWSKYLTGKQGVPPNNAFDPLKYWIDEAHKRGIAIHAWINPYRITKKTASEPAFDYSQLAENHPARLHPEWVVAHTDGNLYFNPGLPEVRSYIKDSIVEIIDNYDVDGIHFDDYFYPSTIFDDRDAYAKYGGKFTSISDWRRANVDQMITEVYAAIKAKKPSVQFGISPFGIWANSKNIATGSQTNGFESYFSQYADTKKWTENNMIDYIAPQLYWNIGYGIADYSKLLNWWSDVAKDSNVNLYIGHAAYRVGSTDISSAWYGVNEIYRQLSLNKNYSNVSGSIFFRYSFFKNNSDLRNLITNYYKDPKSVQINEKLIIGRPAKDVSTTSNFYFIGGASDYRYPVFINGQEIKIKTSQGYFGVYIPLIKGLNTFIITQNGQSATRKVTKITPALAPPMARVEIIPSSTWPQNTRMIQNDEEISFYCKAPIGATVTATLYGKTYTLIPAVKTTTAIKPYATSYTLKVKLPQFTGKPRIITLGKPVYKMTYKGLNYSTTANAFVRVALKDAPYIATISKDFVDSYETPSTASGAHFILNKGMKDYVTGEYGDYIRLSSGLWVKKENVTVSMGTLKPNRVDKIVYVKNSEADEIQFIMTEHVISTVTLSGSKLIVTFNETDSSALLSIPGGSMLKSSIQSINLKTTTYELLLNDASQLSGYYLEEISTGVKLVIRKKFIAYSQSTRLPLLGSTIMLDPGHGGTDSGAIGLLGALKPEKTLAFDHVLLLKNKLEALGASVVLTRTEDIYTSLGNRLMLSKKILPNLFISIHADSVEDTSNISNISGFTIYYKDVLAKSFAEKTSLNIASNLMRKNRGARVMNFYVVRGTWTPSILIETGFLPNPGDFQQIVDPYEQNRFADTIADSIVKYYTK